MGTLPGRAACFLGLSVFVHFLYLVDPDNLALFTNKYVFWDYRLTCKNGKNIIMILSIFGFNKRTKYIQPDQEPRVKG